ncbi:MAG: HNH endonuclease, partial [Methanobacterium sp.]
KVYEHHYVMYNEIKRPLNVDECVHHIDRDRTNNNLNNLILMTHSEHTKLHAVEDRNSLVVTSECKQCKISFIHFKSDKRIYCSQLCNSDDRIKFKIEKHILEKLVWEMPSVDIAKMYNVSDVAVAKKCKKFGIAKPTRGYWTKNKIK